VAIATAIVTTVVVAVVLNRSHQRAAPPTTTTTSINGGLSGVPGRPFAATSFWNAPLPTSTPLDPRSSTYIQELQQQMSTYYGGVGISTTKFSAPIYIVGPGQPTVPFHFYNCRHQGEKTQTTFESQMSAVPVPPNASIPTDSDAEIVVWQPSTNQEWETWKTRKTANGGWEACWGGHLSGPSYSEGIFAHPFGATATGLPLLGGEITMAELKAGHINHTIGLAIHDARRGVFSWPANRTDGQIADPNAIPEGQRFRLDPSVDVAALHLNRTAEIIALAAQRYGIVVWDRAGAVVFRAENPMTQSVATQANPYSALFGVVPALVLHSFPWDRLEALPFDYGRSGG
jgi:hypothetical protein